MATRFLTVVAVDVSGSTFGVSDYFENANIILKSCMDFKLVLWSSSAEFSPLKKFSLKETISGGGTELACCIELLHKVEKEQFNLIIVTDGMVSDVEHSRKLVDRYKLKERIQHVDVYFIGNYNDMNLEINTVFEGLPQRIYINMKLTCRVQARVDWEDLDLDEFLNDLPSAKSTLITKSPSMTLNDKEIICRRLRNYLGNAIRLKAKGRSNTYRETIRECYSKRDESEFANFVKTIGKHESSDLQRDIQSLIHLVTTHDQRSRYTLDNVLPIEKKDISISDEDVENEREEEEEETDEAITKLSDMKCEILYGKCRNVCMLIQQPAQPLFTQHLRQYADNPFKILHQPEELEKLMRHVEHAKVDFKTYQKLHVKDTSPFTRRDLKGAFILHGEGIDVYDLVQHNSRSISILFGKGNKLPGCPQVWNMVVLYAVANHHPSWKEYRDLLHEEIRYIAENTSTYMTLSSRISPCLRTSVAIALWYCVEVSPIAFPNSSKNRLRAMGRPLYQFYSDVFGKPPKLDETLVDLWEAWNYMVRRQQDRFLSAKVLAQIQNHTVIQNKFVFFRGECEARPGFLSKFDSEIVLKLYTLLESKKRKAELYENLTSLPSHPVKVVPVEERKDDETMDHVEIHIETCQPLVMCPVTGLHWKKCAGAYDVPSESYFRLFRRYCTDFEKYPQTVEDLMLYISERYSKANENKPWHKRYLIFQKKEIYETLEGVIKKFEKVMEKYTCGEFLEQVKKFQSEELRLNCETGIVE